MRRFAKLNLFVCFDTIGRGESTEHLPQAYEDFIANVLEEFITEPDLIQLYQSLVFCLYKLELLHMQISKQVNEDHIDYEYLKNTRSFVKSQLRFIRGLIAGERGMRTIERTPKKVRTNYGIRWTKSKTDLVELAYAAVASGSFNDGNIEIKELLTFFSEAFEVPLGNFYETYVQIRRRKGSRTVFLDEMIRNLLLKMDDSDDKFYRRN